MQSAGCSVLPMRETPSGVWRRGRFTFFPLGVPLLLGRRVAEILDFAEARGVAVDRTAKMLL